eukprot:CAMPEP_0174716092 /NCGR_PEP_ID=MMETSP1094-20130205/22820_1 /TAXON_ID=156173 /ORGANISM="Chrysochromulina brevifilum, Strain UTEX LB 985" /LENGTH=195 /DNA_ID=CAMNT_0015915771 /DNA_START=736 /DNA_END=1323 /DNA_ORIENTATION=-
MDGFEGMKKLSFAITRHRTLPSAVRHDYGQDVAASPPPLARLRPPTATTISATTASAVVVAAIQTLPPPPPPPAAHVLDNPARMAVAFGIPPPLPSLELTWPFPSHGPLDKPLLPTPLTLSHRGIIQDVAADHHLFLLFQQQWILTMFVVLRLVAESLGRHQFSNQGKEGMRRAASSVPAQSDPPLSEKGYQEPE